MYEKHETSIPLLNRTMRKTVEIEVETKEDENLSSALVGATQNLNLASLQLIAAPQLAPLDVQQLLLPPKPVVQPVKPVVQLERKANG
jgi:hypothetical protein